jgi:nucleoside-diphosphate-sugar epimerase
MTVLLTGGTGFIGRAVLRRLAGSEDVVAIARGDVTPELEPLARWVRHDLAAPLDPARLPERVDTIVHLAQSARYREFPDGAADVFALNVSAPAALLEYARGAGARRFVLCSTGGVYGYHDEHVRESHSVSPINFYLASKYAAEVLLGPYRSLLHTVVLRPFFVYGPGQSGMLVASLAQRVLEGEEVTVDGDPGLRINPIHVEDAARAVEAAMRLDSSELINVAGDEAVTITDLVQRLAAAAGAEARIAHRGDGPSGDLLGDNSRMKTRLGISPQVPLDAGLRTVIEALRDRSRP